VGANILLLAMGLFGITIFTDLSWLRLMDTLGYYTLVGFEKLRSLLKGYLHKREEEQQAKEAVKLRQDAVVRQKAKMQERIPPTIAKPIVYRH